MKITNTIRKKTNPATAVLAGLLPLTGGMAFAGTFAFTPWVDDSSLSFVGTTGHTHAGDITPGGIAGDVTSPGFLTHNLVVFDSLDAATGFPANPSWTGSNYTVSGGTFAFDAAATANGSAVTGTTSTDLATAITAGGTNTSFNLSGLATNTNYTFYFFSPVWNGDPGSARTGTLESSFISDFSVIEDTSSNFSQEVGNDQIVSYTYNTGANTSIFIRTNSDTGASLHSYAFYNAVAVVVPEPSSSALLALGGLALVIRRKK